MAADPATKSEAVARAMCAASNPMGDPDHIWPYLDHPQAKPLWQWHSDAADLAISTAAAWDEAHPIDVVAEIAPLGPPIRMPPE